MDPLPACVCVRACTRVLCLLYMASSIDSSIHIHVVKCENPCCMLILPLIKQILHYMQKLTLFSHVLRYGSGTCMHFSWSYVVISCANIMTSGLEYGPTLS